MSDSNVKKHRYAVVIEVTVRADTHEEAADVARKVLSYRRANDGIKACVSEIRRDGAPKTSVKDRGFLFDKEMRAVAYKKRGRQG